MKATIYYEIATTNGPATYFSTELTEELKNDTDLKSMWANFFIEVRLELTIPWISTLEAYSQIIKSQENK